MEAQHTALAVSDRLIRLSIRDENLITPLQAQKLTYFCHAWMLGLGHGPLFQDAVESWQYGPVVRMLYHELKHYGGSRIREPILIEPDIFTPLEESVIDAVWQQYGHFDGITLSRMTHAEGSPWHQTYSQDNRTQIIYNRVIRDYHAEIIRQRRS